MLDILAYDHVLFIIVLTIIYNFNQWKKVVWLITFFTLGHSMSLGLAAYDIVHVPIKIVEFSSLSVLCKPFAVTHKSLTITAPSPP